MNITLYNSIADPKRVDKLLLLTVARRLTGYLRHGASVINPVVEIELGLNEEIIVDDERVDVNDEDGNKIVNFGLNIFRSNYMYIAEFQRYYFITNIESLNNRLWAIHGHVDVLQSYAVELRLHTALIDRNEFSYNSSIIDERRTFNEKVNIINVQLKDSDIKGKTEKDKTINQFQKDRPSTATEDTWDSTYRYIVTIYSPEEESSTGYNKKYDEKYTYNDNYKRSFNSNTKYVVDANNLSILTNSLNSPDGNGVIIWNALRNLFANNPIEGIVSVMGYPISLSPLLTTFSNLHPIRIGEFETGAVGFRVNNEIDRNFNIITGWFFLECLQSDGTYLPKIEVVKSPQEGGTFKDKNYTIPVPINDRYGVNWWDYTSEISIFLPYAGFITLYPYDIINKRIFLKLGIDGETGAGIYYIYTEPYNAEILTDLTLIKTVNAQIGMPISMSSTNHQEKLRNILQLGVSTASGALLGGGVGAVVGAGASLLSGGFTTNVQRGTFTGGNWAENYVPAEPFINIIRKTPTESDEVFKHENGLPLKQERLLALVTGYTEISKIRLNLIPRATKTELDELEELLRVGVIF